MDELEQVRQKVRRAPADRDPYGHEVEEYVGTTSRRITPVTVFLSREGYFKKITPKSLRMSGSRNYKEGDGLRQQAETGNNAEIMFFTDRCQVYKTRVSEFGDSKASVLGDYLPGRLAMDEGERVIFMVLPGTIPGACCSSMKTARLPGWSCPPMPRCQPPEANGEKPTPKDLWRISSLPEDRELALVSTEPRALLVHTSSALTPPRPPRNVQGGGGDDPEAQVSSGPGGPGGGQRHREPAPATAPAPSLPCRSHPLA